MDDFKYKKAYGQNFLNDNEIVVKIVRETNIDKDSLVLEVGPGSGRLTKELAKVAKNVLAFEIDSRLEDILDENLREFHNVNIIFDDFLNRDIQKDISGYEYQNLYLVANIPYYITTPILLKIINSHLPFSKVVVMVQKEVGDRFNAKVGTRAYGSITVFLNYYFNISKMFIVNRNSFTPKPNVDSVVLSLEAKKEKYCVQNEELFFKLVRDSFHFKRKNLRNNLKEYDLLTIEKVLSKHGRSLNSRAEELSIEIFVDLANALFSK